ncbi:cell division protein FtsZ, partial [Thermodesulfobacteriota bacterium]
DEVQITVIATGIDKDHYNKVVRLRDVTQEEADSPWTVKVNGSKVEEETLDIPTFQRIKKDDMEEEPVDASSVKKGIKAFFKDNLDYPTFLRAKAD